MNDYTERKKKLIRYLASGKNNGAKLVECRVYRMYFASQNHIGVSDFTLNVMKAFFE